MDDETLADEVSGPEAGTETTARSKSSCASSLGKGCLIILAAGVAVTALFVGAFYLFQRSQTAVQEEAERFLGILSDGRYEAAYETTATSLRRMVSPESFAANVRQLPLEALDSLEWTKRMISRDARFLEARITARQGEELGADFDPGSVTASAELTGTLARATGGTLEINMTMVKEKGHWRVADLNWNSPSANTEIQWQSAAAAGLAADQLRALATGTLVQIGEAREPDEMRALYDSVASRLRRDVEFPEFETSLEAFREDVPFDLSETGSATLTLEPAPAVSSDGRYLKLSGRATMPEGEAVFAFLFEREEDEWLLLQGNVDRASERGPRPSRPG